MSSIPEKTRKKTRFLLIPLLLMAVCLSLGAEVAVASEPGPPVLTINVNPPDARIWFDRVNLGKGEREIDPFTPGTYLLEFRLPGYASETLWLTLDKTRSYEVNARLSLLQGILDLSGLPAGTRVYRDNRLIEELRLELPAGRASLKLLRFGYAAVYLGVEILPGETVAPESIWLPVSPAVLGLDLSRRTLRPGSVSGRDRLEGRIRVSAATRGYAEIADSRGVVLQRLDLPFFDREEQAFDWDGLDGEGNLLPDGEYLIRAVLTGPEGKTDIPALEKPAGIDSRAADRPETLWSGSSGLMLAPRAAVLPRGDFQTETSVMIHPDFETPDGGGAVMSLHAGLRYAPVKNWEADLTAGLAAGPADSENLTALGISLRHRLPGRFPPWMETAVQLRGTLQFSSDSDYFTNYSGGAFNLPLEINLPSPRGTFRFLAVPELQVSGSRIDPAGAGSVETGFFARLYGRTGVSWESGGFSAGISAAFRSAPFLENTSWEPPVPEFPLETAGELHWLLPGARMDLSALFLLRFGETGKAELSGGLGILLY